MTARLLFTIGYEGSSIEDFLDTIELVGVRLLLDIRDVAVSRKQGFSKSILAAHLKQRGIEYLHLRGLGDPKPGRQAARAGRHDEFMRIYRTHLQGQTAQGDLQRGVAAATDQVACLLCFERDHTHCHRTVVAAEMGQTGGFRIKHIGVQPERVRSRLSGEVATHAGVPGNIG